MRCPKLGFGNLMFKRRHGKKLWTEGVEACGMAQARRMVSRCPLAESCTGWD